MSGCQRTACRGVIRTAVILGLTGAAVGFVAEQVRPGSVRAAIHQVGGVVGGAIDRSIDDPAALRASLEELTSAYPERIASVRHDLTEVRTEIGDLERKREESRTVAELAGADLARLDGHLAEARAEQIAQPHAVVKIAFEGERLSIDGALTERRSIERTRDLYGRLATELDRDLGYLRDQEGKLSELLTRLETEQAEFHAQLYALETQIDAVARNERLIASIEDRQERIDELGRYRAHSLDHIHAQLAEARAGQDARLAQLAGEATENRYVDLAKALIEAGEPAAAVAGDEADEDTARRGGVEIEIEIGDVARR